MADEQQSINVEVAYALPDRQLIVPVSVKVGTNMVEAVELSGIVQKFPEIDMSNLELGIFGKAEKNPESHNLRDGDRVEIYRPLLADPKEVRKKRAEDVKAKKSGAS